MKNTKGCGVDYRSARKPGDYTLANAAVGIYQTELTQRKDILLVGAD